MRQAVTVAYFLVLRRRAGLGDSSSAGGSAHRRWAVGGCAAGN